jgi:hypothetical protein
LPLIILGLGALGGGTIGGGYVGYRWWIGRPLNWLQATGVVVTSTAGGAVGGGVGGVVLAPIAGLITSTGYFFSVTVSGAAGASYLGRLLW